MRREQRGAFAFLGDFFDWLGILRRLQVYIQQANLTYRAADVFAVSIDCIAIVAYLRLGFVMDLYFLLQLLLPVIAGALPIVYIVRKRNSRAWRSSKSICPTRSICSPAPCAPDTTSIAASKPSPTETSRSDQDGVPEGDGRAGARVADRSRAA